jgi:steroid 5-alpha reductase family enzyme
VNAPSARDKRDAPFASVRVVGCAPVTSVLLASAAVLCIAMVALWLLSLRLRDASIVDVFWGPAYALVAAVAAGVGNGDPLRGPLVQALVTLWGLRLGAYLWWRNRGAGEDPRYQAMRRRHGERFGWISLRTVFLLQAALAWIVSLPVQVVRASAGGPFGALDAAGVALFAVGFAFEAIGDAQLARFKSDPANRGRVMDRGLWRYTRHPNYFGDCCVWWGIFLIAAGTPAGLFTLPAPLLMSFLLLRVSGVPLLERGLRKRRPGYAEYAARTSAFIPWRPRKRSAQRGEAERSR